LRKKLVATLALLTGCVSHYDSSTLDGQPIDQVILRTKQEVAYYQQRQAVWEADPPADPPGDPPGCASPTGIDFVISKIKLDLTATHDNKSNGSLGLEIPYASGLGKIGPSFAPSVEYDNTQELTWFAYPTTNTFANVQIPGIVQRHLSIAPTLIAFRNALIQEAANKPCLKLRDPNSNDADTLSINFAVKRDQDTDLGFSFAILNANAEYDRSSNLAHAIVVTFVPCTTPSIRAGQCPTRSPVPGAPAAAVKKAGGLRVPAAVMKVGGPQVPAAAEVPFKLKALGVPSAAPR